MSECDDELMLSPEALEALKAFYTERDAHAEKFAQLQAAAEELRAGREAYVPLSMDAFAEDWNESQFWYTEEVATTIAKQLLDGATDETAIAIISVPSVFIALKNLMATAPADAPKPKVILLEHDNRFAIFPEFIFYDYAYPFKLPANLKGTFDRFACDPPFLAEDCQTKTALTLRWLSKAAKFTPHSDGRFTPDIKLVMCTGERMERLVHKLHASIGVRTTDFEPTHARGLSNEFYCYANFEVEGVWKFAAAQPSAAEVSTGAITGGGGDARKDGTPVASAA
ncbi:putative N6-adenine methyltransferase-domain-containing protein [Lasiosphaeria hispida]|uniref:Protein-lysine N-methyltransferase EFM5 n=1 Tax=Lasiosphaeria hispida TaxID=260671 RepID=A0AAJ0HAZ8_9PEZI|nr:putative N6-adenine methyltransferase-domain-containing protein [Lasiosphaeria hispida]